MLITELFHNMVGFHEGGSMFCGIQAYIFTILATIFISAAVEV